MKIKAYVLFLTLLLMLIFSVFTYSLLMIFLFHKNNVSRIILYEKYDANLTSALSLASLLTLENDINYKFDLYQNSVDSIEIKKSEWGVFSVYHIGIKSNTEWIKKFFFAGYTPVNDIVFNLSDFGKLIYYNGIVDISGKCVIPSKGFRLGSVSSRSINKLHTSLVQYKSEAMPLINNRVMRVLERFSSDSIVKNIISSSINISIYSPESIYKKFEINASVYASNNLIRLINRSINGKIIIISSDKIEVDSTSILSDVILIAPKIYIKNGFKGSFQCYATDSLVVGKNVELLYPSALCVYANNNDAKMIISDNVTLLGTIIGYSKGRYVSQIVTPNNFMLIGNFYNNGYSEIHGKIYGQIFCNKVFINNNKGRFDDYLTDIKIDKLKHGTTYTTNVINTNMEQINIGKWLN